MSKTGPDAAILNAINELLTDVRQLAHQVDTLEVPVRKRGTNRDYEDKPNPEPPDRSTHRRRIPSGHSKEEAYDPRGLHRRSDRYGHRVQTEWDERQDQQRPHYRDYHDQREVRNTSHRDVKLTSLTLAGTKDQYEPIERSHRYDQNDRIQPRDRDRYSHREAEIRHKATAPKQFRPSHAWSNMSRQEKCKTDGAAFRSDEHVPNSAKDTRPNPGTSIQDKPSGTAPVPDQNVSPHKSQTDKAFARLIELLTRPTSNQGQDLDQQWHLPKEAPKEKSSHELNPGSNEREIVQVPNTPEDLFVFHKLSPTPRLTPNPRIQEANEITNGVSHPLNQAGRANQSDQGKIVVLPSNKTDPFSCCVGPLEPEVEPSQGGGNDEVIGANPDHGGLELMELVETPTRKEVYAPKIAHQAVPTTLPAGSTIGTFPAPTTIPPGSSTAPLSIPLPDPPPTPPFHVPLATPPMIIRSATFTSPDTSSLGQSNILPESITTLRTIPPGSLAASFTLPAESFSVPPTFPDGPFMAPPPKPPDPIEVSSVHSKPKDNPSFLTWMDADTSPSSSSTPHHLFPYLDRPATSSATSTKCITSFHTWTTEATSPPSFSSIPWTHLSSFFSLIF